MEDSLYVWFCFNHPRLTLYSADEKRLMVTVLATILSITVPAGASSPGGSLIHLAIFCISPGISVGGDYIRHYQLWPGEPSQIFVNEGCGSFVCSLIAIIVLACYKDVMEAVKCQNEVNTCFWNQHYERLVYLFPLVWRIVVDHFLLVALATLYHRLMLPASIVGSWSQSHFYILITLQWLNSKCDMTIGTYSTLHEEASENHLVFRPPLSKQAVLNKQVQKNHGITLTNYHSSFNIAWVPTRKLRSWLCHHLLLCVLKLVVVATK